MIDFSPIKLPNLPDSSVKHAVLSGQYPQFVSALNNLGVNVLTTECCHDVLPQIAYHADVVFAYLGDNKFLIEHSQINLKTELEKLGFCKASPSVRLGKNYPADVKLNYCLLDDKIICGKNSGQLILSDDKTIISTSQGYAKCSVCVVDEHSVITDDTSIADACKNNGVDALLISKGSVKLDGFDYGFIGGCGGKLSKDTLAFCGDIRTHSDYLDIKSFLSFRGIQSVSLSGGNLIDIGSIIPITQTVN